MVYPCFFSKMALHGGGHLELKKMHKGDFWGLLGIRLGRCPCIIPKKISFLQFYSRFNFNALALFAVDQRHLNDGLIEATPAIRLLATSIVSSTRPKEPTYVDYISNCLIKLQVS